MRRRILRETAVRLAPVALVAAVLAAPAAAADLKVAVATPSVCADEAVLSTIRERFAYGAANVEKRNLDIVAVEKIRQVYDQTGKPSPIPRLFCQASVTLSDGTRSTLKFVVAKGTGFASPGLAYTTDAVEFCVAGHDPWRVHDGACRTTTKFW